MRPRRDWVKLKHTRRERDKTFQNIFMRDETCSKILYKTVSLGTFSIETETLVLHCFEGLPNVKLKEISIFSIGICHHLLLFRGEQLEEIWTEHQENSEGGWRTKLRWISDAWKIYYVLFYIQKRQILFSVTRSGALTLSLCPLSTAN